MAITGGTRLGRYEIRSQLGAGGMGEVYLALDTELDRRVAIKILAEAFASDQQRLQRFIQEAKAASALNHPHILTIYEIGTTGGSRFIATEFIDGDTLRQGISAGMELGEILETAIQAGSALGAAHAAGIIHRDIKPENIMVRRDGYIKLLDFGLAKLTQPEVSPLDTEGPTKAIVNTGAGTVMGTTYYMSPEQAKGTRVDARTDLWSLGAVVYEMVTGQVPFAGESPNETISQILQRQPAPLARYRNEVPAELERIVSKTLTKNLDERYQTAKDLLIDLRNLKRKLEVDAEIDRTGPPEFRTASAISGGQSTVTASIAPTTPAHAPSSAEYIVSEIKRHKLAGLTALLIVAASMAGLGFYLHLRNTTTTIESIAVLPFVNASGNADVEYLSDGMTESLINSLSQLPHLSVKARSAVFRYKGKEVEPQQIGSALSVQGVLNGRFTQRGDDLTLYLSLVDARTGNQVWGEEYNRKIKDLVSLQTEIARDVSQKLRARLSGAEERKLAKNYTENVEAYQLYLKGRYHEAKLTPSEMQTGISYFQQAIEIDPSYALAFVGLADAYRRLALASDTPSIEVLPKAKAAAQKAVEIDDTLAEAHAVLGFTLFLYDRNGKEAENQYRRALELNPNSADALETYAHLLSDTGRHTEALAKIKRARELDPLNLRINALEGWFLIHAGQTDEGLVRLQKTFELDPNYWLAHLFLSSAYIEKGMFTEAIAEARKAKELSGVSTLPIAVAGYALAKSGRQGEARVLLEELLQLSKQRYVGPYNIAMIYNGLGERDQTFAWLERAFEKRDAPMIFLKVEPQWNNLRDDPHFQDLLRRVGLTP